MRREWYFWLLPPTSGILLSIAFNILHLWPLVFVSFVPILIFFAGYKRSIWHIFFGGFFFGLIFFGSLLSWFFNVRLSDWAGALDQYTAFVFVCVAWSVSVCVFSFFTGVWAVVFSILRRNMLSDVLLGAALWVVFEWLRTFGFSAIFFGEGTYWGAHWTFGNLGYAFVTSPLLSWASVGGMYIFGFLVVLVNIVIYLWMMQRDLFSRRIRILCGGIFVFFIALTGILSIYSTRMSGQSTLSVALLHTDFPSRGVLSAEEKKVQRSLFFSLLGQIAEEEQKPDLVVFPENTHFLSSFSSDERAMILRNVSDGKSMTFVDSGNVIIDGRIFSTLSYYDENGHVIGEYRKLLLVPHGEYLPFFTGWIARLSGKNAWADTFVRSHGYTPGASTFVAHTKNGNFGALFCSEILSSSLHASLVHDGADILINTASLSFANNSSLLEKQTKAQAQMRAMETGRFLLRTANGTSSFVVAQDGSIFAESTYSSGVLFANVQRIVAQTLYMRLGDWPLLLSLIICVYGVIRKNNDTDPCK